MSVTALNFPKLSFDSQAEQRVAAEIKGERAVLAEQGKGAGPLTEASETMRLGRAVLQDQHERNISLRFTNPIRAAMYPSLPSYLELGIQTIVVDTMVLVSSGMDAMKRHGFAGSQNTGVAAALQG